MHQGRLEDYLKIIQKEMVTQQNLDELLEVVVGCAQQFFDADLAVLFLYNEETGMLEYTTDAGVLVPGNGNGMALKANEGAAGEAFSTKKPVFIEHYANKFTPIWILRQEYRKSKWGTSIREEDSLPDSVMAVPLLQINGNAIGALTISNAYGRPTFDESYISRAEIFGMLAAIAIQNAHDRETAFHLNKILEEKNRRSEEDLSLAENTLYRRNLELIEAAKYSERVQSEERSRIAADIHDNALQYLYGATALLQAAEQTDFSNKQEICWMIRNAKSYIKQSEVSIRESIHNLRESSALGAPNEFSDALRDYVANIIEDKEISFSFSCEGRVCSLGSNEIEEAVFRIVQEAIRNVMEHAKATSVVVSMIYDQESLTVSVEDNGIGMDLEAVDDNGNSMILKKNHYGLAIMLERAKQAKGWLKLESQPGEGCTVKVCVPFPQ